MAAYAEQVGSVFQLCIITIPLKFQPGNAYCHTYQLTGSFFRACRPKAERPGAQLLHHLRQL